MGSKGNYNLRSPAVKRLMREAAELHQPTDQYFAQPLEDNIFEWHFTVRGPPDTDFADGKYHGRIILPAEYPMKPPSIILLTPNGRFEIGKKICLSMSAHHPETWQPSWSIRTVLLAIIGFMPSKGDGAIGALEYRSEERKRLAKKSLAWACPSCGSDNSTCLLESSDKDKSVENSATMEIASQIHFSSPEETSAGQDKSNDIKIAHKLSPSAETPLQGTEKKTENVSIGSSSIDEIDFKVEEDGKEIQSEQPTHNGTQSEPSVENIVRKRTSNSIRSENIAEKGTKPNNMTAKKESSGTLSLILLWIVVLFLVILIFRRLCMDIMVIGGTK